MGDLLKDSAGSKEKPKSVVVSIDPGFTGALAVFHDDSFYGVMDMPTRVRLSAGKKRTDIDLYGLVEMLKDIAPTEAVIERVAAMPGQGVSSTFRFGEGYGQLCGALAALSIQTTHVHPAKWKRDMGLNQEKANSLDMARSMFKEAAEFLTRKKDNGRAEAILIGAHHIKSRLS